jgi:hypothetical protein
MGISSLIESSDPIAQLANLTGPADIRAFLNMSLSQISIQIIEPKSRVKNTINRSTYSYWESGRLTPRIEQVRQIEIILENALHAELAYDKMLDEYPRHFHIRIEVGARRWFVRAFVACAKCGRPYHITRLASKRCKRCITKSKQ